METVQHIDILLVEDNPNDAELAQRALSKISAAPQVLHMEDGVRALDYLFAAGAYADRDATKTPRLLMLDLKLPKINGLEVLKKIRADERFKKLPVVIFSSSKEDRDLVESYRLGANSYVVKPVNFDNFMSVVTRLGEYWMDHNLLAREPFWTRHLESEA